MGRLALCILAVALGLVSSAALAGPLASIYVVPDDVGLAPGTQQQFRLMGEDADGNLVGVGTVTWSVTGPGTIDPAGLFTAGAEPGTCQVRAQVGSSASAEASVEVFLNQIIGGYAPQRRIGSRHAGRFNAPAAIAIGPSGKWMVSAESQTLSLLDYTGVESGRVQFAEQIGSQVSMAMDAQGCVYVLDSASSRIQKYSASGAFITAWGSVGSGDGQLSGPSALAVDDGEVFVADTGNARIQVFDTNGAFLRSWTVYDRDYLPCGPVDLQFDSCSPKRLWVRAPYLEYDPQSGLIVFSKSGQPLSNWVYHGGTGRKFAVASDQSNPAIRDAVVYVLDGSSVLTIQSYSYYSVGLTNVWGGFGSEEGMLDSPTDIVLDGGRLYVADCGNCRVQALSAVDGSVQAMYKSAGCRPGQFKYPSSLAVDGQGNLYVGDTGNSRVQQFGPNGAFVGELASKRAKAPAYACPGGLVTDAGCNLYVTDPIGMRVLRFDATGSLTAEWPLTTPSPALGTWSGPMGIACLSGVTFCVADGADNRLTQVDQSGGFYANWSTSGSSDGQVAMPTGVASGLDGLSVYVADYGNNRVQKFSGGVFAGKWGAPGSGNGQFDGPAGIATDPSGNVYVADSGNHRVQEFSASGAFLGKIGSEGFGPTGMLSPEGVAVDAQSGVYVADTGNHRIVKYSPMAATSIRDAKLASDSTSVSITGAVVTAAYTSFFYVESADRVTAVRVDKSSHGMTVGAKANVTGTMLTNSEGERYISATSVTSAGSGLVLPLAVSHRNLGGGDWHYIASAAAGQRGVVGGVGLNNAGLLVRISGEVTYVGSGYCYIDDGSALLDGSGYVGVRVLTYGAKVTVGQRAAVTGVISYFRVGGQPRPMVRARSAADVTVI